MINFKLYLPVFLLFFAASFGLVFYHQSTQPVHAASDHVVTLQGDRAVPATLGVKVGESVVFNSGDGNTYSLGEGYGDVGAHADDSHASTHQHDYSGLTSGTFGAGEGYRVEFKKTGVYSFHEHSNPKLGIVVVVYDDTDQ